MYVVPFIATVLISVSAASAAKPDMSYQEAAAAAEVQAQDPALVKWAQDTLAPHVAEKVKELIVSCVKSASASEPTMARIVMMLRTDGVAVTFDKQGSISFSSCIAEGIKKLSWPTPPKDVVYLPLELNVRPSDPEDAKVADQEIRDISPSNKAPEPKRK